MLGELYCEVKQLEVLHLPKRNTRYLEKIKVSPASCTAAADFDEFKRSRLMPCACKDRVLEVGRRSDCRPGSRPYHTLASRSNVTFRAYRRIHMAISRLPYGHTILLTRLALPQRCDLAASPSTSRWLQSVSRHAQVISAMTEHQSASCVIA